ncbi:hypothetical protein LTR97_002378 [Elasticomyces elasticus]|uniref:Zn(2)-C6 fungal-type domain-containing protein n=1 Tax=Elasticomyces elasticus TaxID=574655 RepID=A0AAN7WF12_9PEZI|nr:hypothetical protein LTR97_002378 [Elasticomyces elasticus]
MAASYGGYDAAIPVHQVTDESIAEDRSKKVTQSRQLLSCTKCRERKVKCDRIKPCSACAARGHPKECKFVVEEGNDYSPIQQSYEIRQLRRENQRLRERLQAAYLPHSGDEEDEDGNAVDSKASAGGRITARQRRFKTGERLDNLYFGTPGLANIVHDFANLQLGTHSLTHTLPKPRQTQELAREMYAVEEPMHPFPIFDGWNVGGRLAALLPPREELFTILDSFQKRAQSCSFPHSPDEITKKEVERFLANSDSNAQKHPDMLALIFATVATGLQMGEHDRSGGKWEEGSMAKTMRTANMYIAASMHALRLSSYMHQPTLLGIQTLVMMGPYLTNSGRFLEAWTLFGSTVRMAHSIGLHRDPQLLDPIPSLRDSMVRRTLWWWMLHMDQQYSVTLGRPLGISGFGDCPPPEPLTTNPIILRLGQFVDHFTILARQILSSDGLMNVSKIDEFTDKLVGLWDTMPESLQFNESWSQKGTILPDWPLDVMSATLFAKVQSFLILLNRQRVERTQNAAGVGHSPPYGSSAQGSRSMSYSIGMYGGHEHPLHPAAVRGRDLVINSSVSILQTFLFFHHRNPACLICWTMGQQAFNASMILLIDAWETGIMVNEWWVAEVFAVFTELDRHGVHKLAKLAVQRISDGLAQLNFRNEERKRQASASRRASAQYQHQHQQPILQLDTASMVDWSADAVMGNTGMYLLEDPGLQSYVQPPFQPLAWNMAGGMSGSPTLAHQYPSNPPTVAPSPTKTMIPVSHVTAAPFPVVMSPPFISGRAIPVTNSPYAVGLQPRMPAMHQRSNFQQQQYQQPHGLTVASGYPGPSQSAFTPINPATEHTSPQLQQLRGGRHSHNSASSSSQGPRGVHKLDRTPGGRSQVRRK